MEKRKKFTLEKFEVAKLKSRGENVRDSPIYKRKLKPRIFKSFPTSKSCTISALNNPVRLRIILLLVTWYLVGEAIAKAKAFQSF